MLRTKRERMLYYVVVHVCNAQDSEASASFLRIIFLIIRRPPGYTHLDSSAASDLYKRQVHQYLAGKNQTHFNASTPLTLAETASVFGEMLTFKLILNQTTSKKARKALLANNVEDMLNTVIRQIAFFQFETSLVFP